MVLPFDVAFQVQWAAWRRAGMPRTARRLTTYPSCPLPPPDDRRWFSLVYRKPNPLHVARGSMCGLPQGKTNHSIPVLLPVLRAALRR